MINDILFSYNFHIVTFQLVGMSLPLSFLFNRQKFVIGEGTHPPLTYLRR
jgi:hypothetical protein